MGKKATLLINDTEVGLRKIKEDLFEPNSLEVLQKVLLKTFSTDGKRKPYFSNSISGTEEDRIEIESFSFVASLNRIQETKVLLYSLRLFHDQPVLIMCDKETEKELKLYDYGDLIFVSRIDQDYLDEIREKIIKEKYDHLEKEHHCRSDYIYTKMECMNEALSRFTNTLFLDTDIIILDSLQENFSKKVVLSPHYYDIGQAHFGYQYGFYNAGYIFCADRGFPQFWKHIYLNDSVFYEQECMNRISRTYSIETFDEEHNCGFWRKLEVPAKCKSLHFHLSYDLYEKLEDNNETQYELHTKFRDFSLDYLNLKHKKIYNYIIKICPRYAKKLAFVHFGKCGGVYVNRYLHEIALPYYSQYMSWHEGLNPKGISERDFTREELFEIAETADQQSIVHNHHVSWDKETLRSFNDNGFLTFGFVRDPRDVICSLYFFCYKEYLRHGDNHFLAKELIRGFDEIDPSKISLNDFFIHLVQNSRKGWAMPDFIDEIDFVAEFNNDNFGYFTKKYLDHDHVPQERKNATQNRGYKYYCESGELSSEAQDLIENDSNCIRYLKLIKSAKQVDENVSIIKET
jgi:hypothetical protein